MKENYNCVNMSNGRYTQLQLANSKLAKLKVRFANKVLCALSDEFLFTCLPCDVVVRCG